MNTDQAMNVIENALAVVSVKDFATREATVDAVRCIRAALAERQKLLDGQKDTPVKQSK